MSLIDFLLNIAGLLLWVNFRAVGGSPGATRPLAGFSSLLRSAKPARYHRWLFLAGLLVLLAIRSWLYWRLGSDLNWVPHLHLGVVSLPFNSASAARMALFSAGSFGVAWTTFYLWLLLLSSINGSLPGNDPWQRLVRLHLGRVDRLPAILKLCGPWLLVALLWYLMDPLLARLGMAGGAPSSVRLWEQALVVGVGTIAVWKYLLLSVLALHLLNSYLYLGNRPFWGFVNATARSLLRPLRWLPLRAGRFDLAPLAGLALLAVALEAGERALGSLFLRLSS